VQQLHIVEVLDTGSNLEQYLRQHNKPTGNSLSMGWSM
jgi:hypothetical protein